MIKFHCIKCGQKVRAPDKYAGKSVKCPKCKTYNLLPNDDDIIPLQIEEVKAEKHIGVFCVHCGGKMFKEAVICPSCGCETVFKKEKITKEQKNVSTAFLVISYLLAFFIPIGGIIAAIYIMFQKEFAHGILLIIISLLSWLVSWIFIMALIGV